MKGRLEIPIATWNQSKLLRSRLKGSVQRAKALAGRDSGATVDGSREFDAQANFAFAIESSRPENVRLRGHEGTWLTPVRRPEPR